MQAKRHVWIRSVALSCAMAGAALMAAPSRVEACGGCFAPPGAVQTVTDHRMVLSVSSTQTTLWDQFAYTGNPAEFSWILPVRNGPDVRVELADNRFMQVLDNITVPTLSAPQRPSRYCSGGAEDFARNSPSAAADSAVAGGVVVHREEVVGPYAIAVVGGTNAMAIRMWMRDNGFTIPPVIEPVIDHYVALRQDFIALKLRGAAAAMPRQQMTPIRVTVPGYAPTLPLRMVAAGISDKVGLSLLVIANTRFQAANYPNGEVRDADLVWDWNAMPAQIPADDFRAAQRAVIAASSGRAWVTESATPQFAGNLQGLAQRARFAIPGGPPVCPSSGADGGVEDSGSSDGGPAVRCMEPTPEEDMRVALQGISGQELTVTRLRAELSGSLLDRDLQLEPSAVPSTRAREYRYGVVRNEPPPPPPCANPSPARPVVAPIRCTTLPATPGAFGLAGFAALATAVASFARRARRKAD